MKESTRVLLALVLGIVVGLAAAASGSASILAATDWLAPIGTLWVNAIRMTVVPLLVSLVITGLASTSDLKSIGRMGTRTAIVFVAMVAGIAAVIVPTMPLVFALLPSGARPALPTGAAEAAGQVANGGASSSVSDWLVSLLPTNPIAAAASGAIVPLTLFALLFALAIAHTPPSSRERLVGFFRALGDAMLVLVRWVIALAPIGVFALVVPIAARAGASIVGAIGFYIVAYALACLVMSALLYPVVAALGRVSLARFAKAALPAQLIALTSSSTIATLPAMVESAERGLDVDERVTGFVLPLGAAMFRPAAPVSWTVGALFLSWFYGVPLHATQLVTIAVAAIFLGFAGPGVPRGAFILLAPLLVAIGLPPEGVGILIAVDVIPDTCSTVLNVTGNIAATAIVARAEGARASATEMNDGRVLLAR